MMKCRNCELQFIYPLPSPDDLYKIYQKDYYKAWGNEYNDHTITTLKEKFYQSILECVEKYRQPGPLLDAGCAFGHSFAVAMRKGWEPFGVEISSEAYKIAESKFPSRITFGDYSKVKLNESSYDLVLMLDFLEHTPDLIETMMKTHKVLKPGGLVAIVIPDINSVSARLMREYWIHIKLEHLYYLSRKTLEILIAKTGFRVIWCKTVYKPINLLYFESQIKKYELPCHSMILKLLDFLKGITPHWMQRLNISLPQGELLALAQKI
ncbi:MAG: class I SAM-dependent methyltransferase [bacterium]